MALRSIPPFVAVAALFLHGCALAPATPYPTAAPVSRAAPLPRTAPLAPPYGWQIYPITRNALFTGSRPGENVYLLCSPGHSTGLFYFIPADAPRSGALKLISGPLTTLLAGRIDENRATPPPISSDPGPLVGLIIGANVPPGDPVMKQFLETGELTLIWGPHSLTADVRPEQLPALRRNCL